jgi:hypothetical protein
MESHDYKATDVTDWPKKEVTCPETKRACSNWECQSYAGCDAWAKKHVSKSQQVGD